MPALWLGASKYILIRSNIQVRNYSEVTDEEKTSNKHSKVVPLINFVIPGKLNNPHSEELFMDAQMILFWGTQEWDNLLKSNQRWLKTLLPVLLVAYQLSFPFGKERETLFLFCFKGWTTITSIEIWSQSDYQINSKPTLMDFYCHGPLFYIHWPIDELHLRDFQGIETIGKDRLPAHAELNTDAQLQGGRQKIYCQAVFETSKSLLLNGLTTSMYSSWMRERRRS